MPTSSLEEANRTLVLLTEDLRRQGNKVRLARAKANISTDDECFETSPPPFHPSKEAEVDSITTPMDSGDDRRENSATAQYKSELLRFGRQLDTTSFRDSCLYLLGVVV